MFSFLRSAGELIVSKIKTNEQMSLAKKISNDLLEWQKSFSKMNYYIKYFSELIEGERLVVF